MALPAIKSLFGNSASRPERVPGVSESAPKIDGINYTQSGHIIAFVRHCGCPFAENEVQQLAKVSKNHPKLRIVIVAHSDEEVVQDWFNKVGKPHFDSLDRVEVRADPQYKLYNAFGIGQLGWTDLFTRQTFSHISDLKSKGITIRETGKGSNRWLNSGGFAVDHGGIIKWAKVASEASDMCNYEEAAETIA